MATQTSPAEANNLFFPIIILLLPILLLIFKHLKPSPSLPPGPSPFSWTILASIPIFIKSPHLILTHFSKIYGPLFSLKIGTQLYVVGSSREAAIEILRTNDRVLSGRRVPSAAPPNSMKLNDLSFGWMSECNDQWKYLRTFCKTELFSTKALESQAGARDTLAMELLNFMNKMEGKVVKIRPVAFAAIFNMLGNVMVSRDVISFENASLEGEICEPIRELVKVGTTLDISDFLPILAGLDLQGLQRKSRNWYKKTCEIWEPIIHERREMMRRGDASSQRDFLDALLANGSSNDQINMLLLDMFIAGTDTSSSTIEWLMAELMKNPKCMEKVQEEIEGETKGETVKHYHLPQLTYLEACFKESLRLHPPAPVLLPHRAVESCKVMNFDIPKDAQVIVNFWAISRDPKNWEEPLVYKPERFLKSNSSLDYKGNDYEFIPFGSGKRICPGYPMAATNVPFIVACLIQNFDWYLPNGEDPTQLDMNEKNGVTLSKKHPLLLIPKPKKVNHIEV